MSNVKQIALAIMQYTQDYDEHYPMKWYQKTDGSGVSQKQDGWPGKTYQIYSINGGTKVLYYWTTWQDMIYPYIKNVQIFCCPSYTANNQRFSYQLNGGYTGSFSHYDADRQPVDTLAGTAISAILRPSETVMIFEVRGVDSSYGLNGVIADMPPYQGSLHLEGTNLAYGDGHVKWMSTKQLIASSGTDTSGICHLPSIAHNKVVCSALWNPFRD
jgi:prepilin-type processing-associated H-X9-DG protein